MTTTQNPPVPLSDDEFLKLCESGTPEEITQALAAGTNPNAGVGEYSPTLMKVAARDCPEATFAHPLHPLLHIQAAMKKRQSQQHFGKTPGRVNNFVGVRFPVSYIVNVIIFCDIGRGRLFSEAVKVHGSAPTGTWETYPTYR